MNKHNCGSQSRRSMQWKSKNEGATKKTEMKAILNKKVLKFIIEFQTECPFK